MIVTDILLESSALNWALDPKDRQDKHSGYQLVHVNVADLWKNINPDWLVTNQSKTNHIKNRFEGAVEHFRSGQPMDPPTLSYSGEFSAHEVQVVNGRHRIAAAVELGQQWIPAFVLKEDLPDLKRVIQIR